MNPNTPNSTSNVKKPSRKPSITGGVLSILALMSSGIAYFLTHSESRSQTEVTTAVGTVDSGPVADIAEKSVTGILSVPFSVAGIFLALIAIIFTLVRLRKVKVTGFVVSLIWVAISIWAIALAIGAFDAIKATPAN